MKAAIVGIALNVIVSGGFSAPLNANAVNQPRKAVTAHKTAGHTRGCTTWSLRINEAGHSYDVVIVGSPNVNPGYELVNNVRYPEIANDYARGFGVLKSLPCDVFLGAHGSYFEMESKYSRLSAGGANPYVDSEGYKKYVMDREQAFLSELQKQTAAAKKQ